jgi:hypothetical protein
VDLGGCCGGVKPNLELTNHQRGNYGENLAMGHRTASLAVQGWVNERSSYNYNYGDFSAATGHFTQVVWKGSTRLGCGARLCGGQW